MIFESAVLPRGARGISHLAIFLSGRCNTALHRHGRPGTFSSGPPCRWRVSQADFVCWRSSNLLHVHRFFSGLNAAHEAHGRQRGNSRGAGRGTVHPTCRRLCRPSCVVSRSSARPRDGSAEKAHHSRPARASCCARSVRFRHFRARPGDRAGSGSPVTWLTGQPSQTGPPTAHLRRARPPAIRNAPLVVPPGTSKYPVAADPLHRMAASDDRPAGTYRDFIGPSRAWALGLRKRCTVGVRQPALRSRVFPTGFDFWDTGIDAVVRQTRGKWIVVRCACVDDRKIL